MKKPLDDIFNRMTKGLGTSHIPFTPSTPAQSSAWSELVQFLESRGLLTQLPERPSERAMRLAEPHFKRPLRTS